MAANKNSPSMAEEKSSSSIRFALIGAVASVIAALFAFFVTFVLSPSQKPSPTPTPSVLSFAETVGLNLDTNPPTVGPPTISSLTVTEANRTVDFTAKLPSSLAYITNDTSNPPSLSACQRAIAGNPTLSANIQDNGWVCVRTAQGATKAIRIVSINPSNTEIEVYELK